MKFMIRLIIVVGLVLSAIIGTTSVARADNVWIWGVCTDLNHPFPSSSEPYNFNAVFRIKAPYSGWYKLVDNYGHTTPSNRTLTAGEVINTGYIPVDYNGSFKERLYWLHPNGVWYYIDQSVPRFVDDSYCL